jgi:hypothetical protein
MRSHMSINRLKRRAGVPAAAAAVALLWIAPPAGADVGETIIQRCTHGQSLAGFTPAQYRRALQELGADAEEYTDCAALIRQAELGAAGSRGSAEAPAGVAPIAATAAEQQSIRHAARAASGVPVGNQLIRPGVVHADIASAVSSLPAPLMAIIAFLLASLTLVTGGALRNRIRARRSDD